MACENGHHEMVSLLQSDMRVDVNKPDDNEVTPLNAACSNGHKEVVSLLLTDMRIDTIQPDKEQCTPLWFAAQQGHLSIAQAILASGREVDTKTKAIAGTSGWNHKTAAEIGRLQGTSQTRE